jgi:hypothetical protein
MVNEIAEVVAAIVPFDDLERAHQAQVVGAQVTGLGVP